MIAHVDMDAFFAAVEEKYNPKLKGKPVIVGALPTQKRGIVSTCNYEARKFGIHSAMPISHAYKRCPKGIYLRPNFRLYIKESRNVMSILRKFSEIEQVSIDEAYLEIDPKDTLKIKKEVKKINLSCSIGLANSRYIAKIASDYKKPGGIIVVKQPRKFLAPMSIRKIPGIGKKTEKYLNEKGIKTIADLAKDKYRTLKLMGKWGEHIYNIATGKDRTGLLHHGPRKSQSVERTYQDDKKQKDCLDDLKKLCKRLKKYINYEFKTVSLKVRFEDFSTITRAKTKENPDLEKTALEIFNNIKTKKKIRLIGVRVSNLSRKGKQLTLKSF
ncbi:DNA polymerase IV [Candidatus Woesearchaeota archaeon]|nr:DNA polymerase IV [Candidatus Woesearchaeota archaeon]